MRTTKKKEKKGQRVRSLKIQPIYRFNQWSFNIVPEIKLVGKWLDDLGFTPEKRVNVTTEQGIITIRLQE